MLDRSHLALSLTLALAIGFTVPVETAHAKPATKAPASQAPAVKTVATPNGPVKEVLLKNGLKVILQENHAAPVVTWAVTYKVGSRNEPVGATGSAHLLEHMLFKGTKTLGKGQIAQLLGRNGASYNAFTAQDITCYYETYSSDRLEMGLMVEAARMRDALILDSERQSEMTVVRNEMERGESDPSRVLWQEMEAIAFRSHPYHHPVIGWRADVENVPTRQLKQFYDTYYQPNNAVAVLVGDFNTDEAIAMIRRQFETIPAGPKPPAVYTHEEPQLGERRVTLRRKGETNLVSAAYHTPKASHKDIAALLVLDSILSAGVTSRLHQALVEKEVATSAWSYQGVQRDPSLFWVGATLKPGASHETVEKALFAELEKIKAEPVTAAELTRAKNQAEADYVYENEGAEGTAFALLWYEGIDRWQRNFQLLDDLRAVQAADIQRVAKSYLNGDNRTTGWYVASADGPVPPLPANSGSGKAVANSGKVKPPAMFAFEKRPFKQPKLTLPTRRVLKNGLTVLVLENTGSRTVSVDGFVRAGSVLDPKGKSGLSGAVAAMLDTGTAKRTKLQLANDLENVAAGVSFSSGMLSTGIDGKMLAKDLDLTLAAMAEMMRQPTFPQDELDKLKNRWVASIKQGEDEPSTHSARAFAQAVFPKDHPYYQESAEDQIKQVESLTVADLKAFHQRYYGPNNTTIVVVGKVKTDAVVAKLEKLFEGWATAEKVEAKIPDVAPGAPKRVVVPLMDKTNVEIVFGHAGSLKRQDPAYYAASLANDIIGGSTLTSRLGVKLRDEMGLTYGTYSGFSASTGAGPWKAQITVNPANTEVALKAMKTELTRFLDKGITADELAFAKSSFIGEQAQGLATNAGMAGSLSNIEFYNLGLDYWARYPKLIQGVTLKQANEAAHKLIQPGKAHTVIVGPVQK